MTRRGKGQSKVGEKAKKMLLFFLPYWLVSFILIFLIFAVVAVVFLITPLSQSTFPFISCFTFVAVEIAISYLMGKFCTMPAIYSGALYGVGLSIIMLIVGLLTKSLSVFSLKFLFLLITGIMVGVFGAIAGFNSKPKRRYGKFTVR